MKFETKINKLGIDENEVKSIIGACECGEINGAYLIDLTKEKKEFIMEVIGNYLDDDSEEFEGWTDIKRIATFCKTFDISEDEIPHYYRLGFNEGGEDIAYELESNPNVLLILTDDERYTNSFIQSSSEERFIANRSDRTIYDSVTQAELTISDAMYLINHTINESRFSIKTLSNGNDYLKDSHHRKLLNVFETADFLNSLDIDEDYCGSEEPSENIGFDEETGIQYEIMTEENKNEEGRYVLSFDELFKEAPTGAMKMKWTDCQKRMGSRPFEYQGFAFNLVVMVKMSCGHYEILQHSFNPEYENIKDVLKNFAEEGANRNCTRCICG